MLLPLLSLPLLPLLSLLPLLLSRRLAELTGQRAGTVDRSTPVQSPPEPSGLLSRLRRPGHVRLSAVVDTGS